MSGDPNRIPAKPPTSATKRPAVASPVPKAAVAPPQRAPLPPALPTGTELAMAFDRPIAPAQTSPLYRLAVFCVFLAMILLPVVYVAIIIITAIGVEWYATHATGMFSAVPAGRATLVVAAIYVGPLIAGGALVLFMVLPLFWRPRKKPERPIWIDKREEPLLYAYIGRLCDAMRAPRPTRIDVMARANASAHIDNGFFGLISRRLVLTIGLPLAQSMNLKQFTGVLAHELGHFTQGGSMRLSYVIHRINVRFIILAYGRSGVDDMLDAVIGNEPHAFVAIIGGICKLVLGIVRLVLKLLAMLSIFLCRHLSRQAEFDADRHAARIVGGEALGEALQALPFLDAANTLGLEYARTNWSRRTLPDDLVTLTQAYSHAMPPRIKDQLTATILTAEASWADTHPPLYKRVAILKKSKADGVLQLNAPATCLFRDFDDLSKLATIDLYQSILGESLQPEHLVPTPKTIAVPKTPSGFVDSPSRTRTR